MPTPASTYRLQITKDFTLWDAVEVVPYLQQLGVDWLYLSPLLQAAEGSDHGYDVVDPSRVDVSRGGDAGLAALSEAAHAAGLHILADIVPNHMGVAVPAENPWWWELLSDGKDSWYARAFDVDWNAGDDRVLLPVLGAAEDLQNLELGTDDDGATVLRINGSKYPVVRGTYTDGDSPQTVHERQHYRLVPWQWEATKLNYRRFFAVSSLAGIRVEDPEVFDRSHAEIIRWVKNGWVDGLRIDHPDGLRDPAQYLARLKAATGGAYLLVEKILEPGEQLPTDWDCEGTTGYDALAVLDRVLVDPAGEAPLTALDTQLRGSVLDYGELIRSTKTEVAQGILNSEIARLARLVLAELAAQPQGDHTEGPPAYHVAKPSGTEVTALEPQEVADALIAIVANFAVYRSYLPHGREELNNAAARAKAHAPEAENAVNVVHQVLLSGGEAGRRFQQTSGMVMAKGVEDCAFFRATRLVSLTEVGADPEQWSQSVDGFHRFMAERQRQRAATMNTLTTHDTKRGEDTRATIITLAEYSTEYAAAVAKLTDLAPLPDGPLANLIWQSVLGSWPASRERLQGYALKAAREAGNSTSWLAPDEQFERALAACIDAVFDNPDVQKVLADLTDAMAAAARSNILSLKLLQLAIPGVPDVYQGSEFVEQSLTDPDNRRPVTYRMLNKSQPLFVQTQRGERELAELPTDDAKYLITGAALNLRREQPERFANYSPIAATGAAAEHLVGFDRGGVVALATRLPRTLAKNGGWQDTTVDLPRVHNVFTGAQHWGTAKIADVFGGFPVALLVKESN